MNISLKAYEKNDKKVIRKSCFLFALCLALVLLSVLANAQEGGEAVHEAGIPKVVYYQALNFFGLLIIMYFLLRGKVRAYFAKRHDTLTAALNEARRLKEEAERKHQEYTSKLQALEKQSSEVLEKVRKEANDSKLRMLEDAKKNAQIIELEAKKTVALEIEKAKTELYEDILTQAVEGARGLLTRSVADNDQRRLQKEFVDKIEAVQ